MLHDEYFGQLSEDLWKAMQGNVDVWCSFRVGPEDARIAFEVTQASSWEYTEKRFVFLPPHHFVSNLLTHSSQGMWESLPYC